ncbi:MAG: hypothetical protein AB7N76_01375 [Planctomycetota bacterium]
MTPPRPSLLPLVWLLLALGPLAAAQAPAPPPQPPQEQPKPKPAAKEQPARPPREGHLDALEDAVVHFEFQRAPLEDILFALARATKVEVHLGKGAQKALDRRKLKIRYVADRTGEQVLRDLCKAASLDYLVSDEGVLVDLPPVIARLRKKLGLDEEAVKLRPKDVARMLETKELSFQARERPLSQVLAFLAKETGIRFVRLTPSPPQDGKAAPATDPPVTLDTSSTPLGELLDRILKPLKMGWLRAGTVILVGTEQEVEAQRAPQPQQPQPQPQPQQPQPQQPQPQQPQPQQPQPQQPQPQQPQPQQPQPQQPQPQQPQPQQPQPRLGK